MYWKGLCSYTTDDTEVGPPICQLARAMAIQSCPSLFNGGFSGHFFSNFWNKIYLLFVAICDLVHDVDAIIHFP